MAIPLANIKLFPSRADLLFVYPYARELPSRFRHYLRVLLAAALCSVPAVCAPPPAATTGSELTSVAQIARLNPQSLTARVPARISGRITYVDGLRSLFLQDSTGGILVQNPNVEVELKRGQQIEVTGDVTRSQPSPAMAGLSVRVINPAAALPHAVDATSDDLTSSSLQYTFVELKGIVRAASEDRESHARALLKLFAYGREIDVSIRDIAAAGDYHSLDNAVVLVRGVLSVRVNALGVPVIFKLAAQSISDVSIVERAPALPEIALKTVFQVRREWSGRSDAEKNESDNRPQHRVRLKGALRLAGYGLVFQDATGSIGMSPSPQSDLTPAASQDLLAFVSEQDGVPILVEGRPVQEDPARTRARHAPGPEAVLTTVSQIRQLSLEEIQRNRKVHLQGVVTYSDPSVRDTFIQDSTGGIFVFAPTGGKLDLKTGQYVQIDGLTGVGGFAPVVTEPTARVLGQRPLPTPIPLDMEQLFTGKADSQMVEASGIVRSARPEAGHLRLEIVWGSHRYLASVAGATQVPPWLLNASVRLTGVCGAVSNFKHQILGIELNVPGLSFIRPDGQAHSEDLPLERIDQVLQYSGQFKSDERARIQGKVVFTNPQGPTYLSDFSSGLLIRTHAPIALKVGDWVEALGTPHSGTFAPFLEDTQLIRIASLKPPQPKIATYDSVLERGDDAEFVRIEGYLVSDAGGSGDQTLLLQAGDGVFEGRLMRGRLPALSKGSLLRITGLTSLRVDESAQILAPVGFSILLRSPEDISVLQTAPWWTFDRLRNAGLCAFALVLLAMAWIVFLRRQVGQQTRELRLTNERLLQLSNRDGLTGIANRRKFDETLEAELSRARRSSSTVCLLLVDIDYFKTLNDDYGHQRGDECLIEVAQALQSVLIRTNDLLARYGGEEFAVILPDADLEGAMAVGEQMRVAVSQLAIPHARSPFHQTLSISIGVGMMRPHAASLPASLIGIADRALYRSKMMGRNRVTALEEASPDQGLDTSLVEPRASVNATRAQSDCLLSP